MLLHQRIAGVIAREGFSGLWPRVRRRLIQRVAIDETNAKRQIVEDYHRSIRIFQEKIRNIDVVGLNRFYWYHTIDLGDGLVTPGEYDHRPFLNRFDFPADMSNMSVLDVGSATGFFAFEFEKRGANVTSIELPSLADWDMPSGHDSEQTLSELTQYHRAKNFEETYYLHLDGPFRFCHERMRSKVARHYSTIYNLASGELKNQKFDLVFLGDILLHLFSPLHALNVVTQLCRHHLIIFQVLSGGDESQPLMLYAGGRSRQGDSRTWWHPNRACLEQMLQRLGFQNVYLGPRIDTAYRPNGYISPHSVIHARRAIH
jgi:tRNA (mo5U34)-methyltransferase